MKKLLLTVFFVTFSINSVFAKKPEIINPPSLHAKFKWLLVIRHTQYPEHTHYIFVDKYRVLEESDRWVWIYPVEFYQSFFTFSNNGIPESENASREFIYPAENIMPVLLKYPGLPFVFLKSKAPKSVLNKNKPSVLDEKMLPYSPYSPGTKILWDKTAKEIELKPQKAKVIFKP